MALELFSVAWIFLTASGYHMQTQMSFYCQLQKKMISYIIIIQSQSTFRILHFLTLLSGYNNESTQTR